MALFSASDEEGVSRTIRDEPPTHFSLRIKLFSLLSNSSLQSYESGNFKAGGYKWKLCLYPKGNNDRNGEACISLYLVMTETNTLSPGWEVYALFRLFLLDQLRDKYLCCQVRCQWNSRRFRATRIQSGFDRFITLKEFNDPSKGYLIKDTCVFGAEVFVQREGVVGKEECLLMTPVPVTCNYTWKIDKFSELVQEFNLSQVFTAADHKWRIDLYPKGDGQENGKSLSLFLRPEDPKTRFLENPGIYVEALLRVKDQVSGKHVERKFEHWFIHPMWGKGWSDFLSLSSFQDQSKGYLVNDVCIIEAQLLLMEEQLRKWP